MLTVREALKMPVFSTATLVAGQGGLDREIHWVHIVDIPDSEYAWERSGVLLLTAGYGLHAKPERQARLVPKLIAEGFAGMVLSTGYYFDETPSLIKEQAEEQGLPIIETPPDLLFINVTEAILEHIVNEQYALLQQANQINDQLTKLILQGSHLSDLADTLAKLLQRSITIESLAFQILANAQFGSVDSAREQSLESGRTSPEIARYLLEKGVYEQLLATMSPVHLPPLPEMGIEMERFVAPIIVDHQIHGYIWIIAGDRPLTALDKQAIRHGATVAALMLFKDIAVRKEHERLQGDFMALLLRGEAELLQARPQASQLGFRFNLPYQLLLIAAQAPGGSVASSLETAVQKWLRAKKIQPLCHWRDQHYLLLFPSSDNQAGVKLAQELVAELSHPTLQLQIGVSPPAAPVSDNPRSIRDAFAQAQEALRISLALEQNSAVMPFTELGFLHWLYHIPPDQRKTNSYLQHIDTLAAYDEKRKTELLATLEEYLEHGGALVETAKALFIHRNTLLHRLQRIEKLCALDLRAPRQQINLLVALKSYRLTQG